MNNQIAKNADKFIQSFSYEDEAIKVSGTFGTWKIVSGGSSSLLHFETPITKGNLVIKSNENTYSLDGAVPLVQLQLSFIDDDSRKSKDLKFNCLVIGTKPNDDTSGAVTVLDPDTTGILKEKNKDGMGADLLKTSLAKALIANKEKLSFVFASVLTEPESSEGFVPKEVVHVYQQDIEEKLGNFAVLGMMEETDISSKDSVFDSELLRPNDEMGFIFSGEQFMKNILLPKMPKAFPGSKSSEFKMSGNNIVNNGKIQLKNGFLGYSSHLDTLKISLHEDSILTVTTGKVPLGLNAYAKFGSHFKNKYSSGSSPSTINFLDDPNPVITHSLKIPWYDKVLLAALALLAAPLGTGPAIALITYALEGWIINQVGPLVSDLIVGKTPISFSDLGGFLVKWPGKDAVEFTDSGLVDNFYGRG